MVRSVPGRAFTGAEFDQPAGIDAATGSALGTARDDDESRLRAGEATSTELVAATHLGLTTCTLTEPLEIAVIRTELGRELLGVDISQQSLIRVGWPDPGTGELPQTPRNCPRHRANSPPRCSITAEAEEKELDEVENRAACVSGSQHHALNGLHYFTGLD